MCLWYFFLPNPKTCSAALKLEHRICIHTIQSAILILRKLKIDFNMFSKHRSIFHSNTSDEKSLKRDAFWLPILCCFMFSNCISSRVIAILAILRYLTLKHEAESDFAQRKEKTNRSAADLKFETRAIYVLLSVCCCVKINRLGNCADTFYTQSQSDATLSRGIFGFFFQTSFSFFFCVSESLSSWQHSEICNLTLAVIGVLRAKFI